MTELLLLVPALLVGWVIGFMVGKRIGHNLGWHKGYAAAQAFYRLKVRHEHPLSR